MTEIVSVLPKSRRQLAFVVKNFLSQRECLDLIQRSEAAGYEQALVNVGGGKQLELKDFRNSDRCLIDDAEVTEIWWERLGKILDETSDEDKKKLSIHKLFERRSSDGKIWRATGFNKRLRFFKYSEGHYFRPHYDGSYEPSPTLRSFTTAIVYLNDCSPGSGLTNILITNLYGETKQRFEVQPETGMLLLFQHNLLHEGAPVVAPDVKYAIRTDVMHTREELV